MKEMIIINLLSLFYILISNINLAQAKPFEIKIIPDSNDNATAAFVSLDELTNIDFLYFKFDLKDHNEFKQRKKDETYFKIKTELSLSERDFRHIFLDKILEEVKLTDLEDKNQIIWKYSSLLSKEKTGNEYNYYILINKLGRKIKGNTLIIRIPVLKSKGQITIENLYTLPEEILEKKNKIDNINIWPKNKFNNNSINEEINNKKNENNKSWLYDNNRKIHKGNVIHRRYAIQIFLLGMILGIIWICLFILFCWTNCRKNEQFQKIRDIE